MPPETLTRYLLCRNFDCSNWSGPMAAACRFSPKDVAVRGLPALRHAVTQRVRPPLGQAARRPAARPDLHLGQEASVCVSSLCRPFTEPIEGGRKGLLDEWERLRDPSYRAAQDGERPDDSEERAREDITADERRFTALVRNLMFGILRALEHGDYDTISDLAEPGEMPLAPLELENRMRPFFAEQRRIQLDQKARSPENLTVDRGPDSWTVSQVILVYDEVSEYMVRGRIDLARSRAERRPVLMLDHVGA